jgi:hypothetical protein
MVTLELAYPLSAKQSERVLAEEVKDYWVGDKITVRYDYARSVINAGFAAGVDPADADAVKAALEGKQPDSDASPATDAKVEKVEESTTPPHTKTTTHTKK